MIDNDYLNNSDKKTIINIVRRSLGYVDKRLIDHGERVAFIADTIASMNDFRGIDREKLLLLSLLHDIGAYKTEEIDQMVHFETNDVINHAVYGYVFLKNTTSLGDHAEAILYHHTRYDELLHIDSPHKTAAELIFLADRIDILLASSETPDWNALRKMSGTVFSPILMDMFFSAQEKYDIAKQISDYSYQSTILALLDTISFSVEETFSFLKMLVYSIDFRSPYTVTHTAHTTAVSSEAARMFGLSQDEQRLVVTGAFLHDIGKISVPYSILENPEKLTDKQMNIMRTHVGVSEEILKGIVSDEICLIAVRHHEKLNGKGYPRGVTAEELTLSQRIVAVADIFSALTEKRSYKEPFSKEKTISILNSMCEANEICPKVCKMVIDNYDYIISVVAQADDSIMAMYNTIQKEFEEMHEFFAKK